MRLKNILFVLVLSAVAVFYSCDDEPAPFDPPKDGFYFNGIVGDYEKAIVDGKNGFVLSISNQCDSIADGNIWSAASLLKQTGGNFHIANKEGFGIILYNVKIDTIIGTDTISLNAAINSYFSSAIPFAKAEGTDTTGAEIIWFNASGDIYSSLAIAQGGYIAIEERTIVDHISGKQIIIKANFNECKVKNDKTGKIITIKNAVLRFMFIFSCI